MLAALSLLGASNPSVRHAYLSARGFVCHFRSIEKSSLQNGLWERVALSLGLTSANPPEPECADKLPKAHPSM